MNTNIIRNILTASLIYIVCSLSHLQTLAQQAGTPSDQTPARPNVILVMTDDQGYGDIGRHGHPILKTPNLDRLYDESVRLTDFHVDPYCAPTRAALMTGRYALRTGVWHTYGPRSWLNIDEVTMAEVFQENGYRTAHFGKWHLGDNYPYAPHYRGFDTSLMLGDGGLGASNDYWGNDRFNDVFFQNGEPYQSEGFATDVFFTEAMNFIEADPEAPFFIYIATNLPHRPWNLPSEYTQCYDDSQIDPPLTVEYFHTDMARFYGSIDVIDENVGRLMHFLDSYGLADNTILIFMIDNGTVSTEYNAGMRGRKATPYEGGHRVPCFIRWPEGGIDGGRNLNALTGHIDLFPTLVDLCSLKVPDGLPFDGYDLSPALRTSESNPTLENRHLFTQFMQARGYTREPNKWLESVVMHKNWRLVNGEELYDLSNDQAQAHDLADKHPDIVKELRDAYESYWKDVYPEMVRQPRALMGARDGAVTKLSLINSEHDEGLGYWSQEHATKAYGGSGRWPIEVVKSGWYRVEARRWPEEANLPMNSGEPEGSKALEITNALLKVQNKELIDAVEPGDYASDVRIYLEEGIAQLEVNFETLNGETYPAYWLTITRE